MKKITFTTAYNRKDDFIRDCNTVKFTKPSMVKESLAYATDINTIYENYCNTGKLPLNGQQPLYDENFIKYDSLIEAQHMVSQASEYFAGLPAKIRNQYGNSLEKFILALNSKDDFLIESGVLKTNSDLVSDSTFKPVDNSQSESAVNIQDSIVTTLEPQVNTATTD